MTSLKVETAHSCLDLLRITWASTTAEPKETVGILLEVSRSGGVLHIDEPVAPGTIITIQLGDGNKVEAEVQSFEEDEFGCYLALQVVGSWFPVQYWPSLMLPDSASIPVGGALEPEPTIQTTQRFVIPSII